MAALDLDGDVTWVHARTEHALSAVDATGSVFGCSTRGVFLLEAGTETSLIQWDDEHLYGVECVAGPDRTLFVTGTTYEDDALGAPLGPPRKKRFATVRDHHPAFVAKFKY